MFGYETKCIIGKDPILLLHGIYKAFECIAGPCCRFLDGLEGLYRMQGYQSYDL